jgi:Mycobacterial 4 TMS phage holin, superfamily IV
MKTLLLRLGVFLGSSAIGLLIAAWLIHGVSVRLPGFVVAVIVFSIAQAILSPFIAKLANRYAPAFLGGIGLLSTLLALMLASILTNGLTIRGIGSWIGATVVVWLVSALATVALPMLFVKKKVD